MPFIADSCTPEESGQSNETFEPLWSSGKSFTAMDSRPNPGKVSDEELRATQARLYLLLIEAQDRLERERGLVRTTLAERPKDSRLTTDVAAEDSSASDDKAT